MDVDAQTTPRVESAEEWGDSDLATAIIAAGVIASYRADVDQPGAGSSTSATITGPPYTAPSDVVYPPYCFINPHRDSEVVQPTFSNLPSGSLFRPAYLPVDIDTRIDQQSVWLGVDKETSKAVYFLPPTCKGCSHPAVAQFCDRGQPKCSRCAGKNLPCIPGTYWGAMRAKGRRKPRADSESRASGSPTKEPRVLGDKGKARAQDPPDEFPFAVLGTPEDEGRGKRVKKRRRLSLTGEVDPNDYDDLGSIKKPMKKMYKPSLPLNGSEEVLTRPEDIEMTRRMEENAARAPLFNMTGSCPVWANSKRALEAAVEYFRKPIKSVGASVEVGVGGIARGVILEGQAPDECTLWKMDEGAGTMIVSIGPDRKSKPAPASPPDEVYVAPHSPQSNPAINEPPESSSSDEAPEIAALLMAQRARTPIALAVASDYSATPFKVPRRSIVLGWFWVTEAWLEPTSSFVIPLLGSRWRFRFDWCPGQSPPWWLPRSVSGLFSTEETNGEVAATISGPGVVGSTTVRDGEGDEWSYKCDDCGKISAKVYNTDKLCLNHECTGSMLRFIAKLDRSALVPAPLRPLPRISPDSLRLQLRPAEPSSSARGTSGRTNAGREFWRAWVCGGCGLAQERKKWAGWECEACHRNIRPDRTTYESDFFRSPTRPIYTGPRQEDGQPQWPFPSSRGWTLYVDDVKVVKHAVEAGLGDGAEVHHALASRPISADTLFRRLQAQGALEVPFRRHSSLSQRVIDKSPSPFYTFLCGTDAPPIDTLPAGSPTPWKKCLASCFDAIDIINDMAGRMFPGQKERFNSLLLAVLPPQLPSGLQPRIRIPPHDYFSILFLGSDAGVKISGYSNGKRGKQGSLTALHGDVIGIKTGDEPVDVVPFMDGFGFLGIGRQVYRYPGSTQSESSVEVEARPTPPVTKSRPRGPALPKLGKQSKLLSFAPLTDWYLGTRPLSRDQPLRVRAPLKQRVVNQPEQNQATLDLDAAAFAILDAVRAEQSGPTEYTGREEIAELPVAELLRPTPISPMGKKKKAEKETEKPKKKAKRKSGAGTPSTVA